MQNQVKRLQWAVILVALRVVGVVALCVAALSFIAFHSTPHAYAADASLRIVSGSISSFPSGGPAGTQITVAGSGWTEADGTSVTFGYELTANASCTPVTGTPNGSLSNGSFSGSFSWPSGTALSTYPVCAVIETTPATTTVVAGNFSVFSSTPPVVSIAPSTLAPNIQATITASNYYPAGMQVNFSWMSGNTVIDNLNSATSDMNGTAVLTFTVPSLSIASGSYSINASVGSGQSAMLPSSTSFTYNAPVLPPSPTPRPSPSPTPEPTPAPTRAATPTLTPTTTASATATATTTAGATPSASASPTVASSQVAATNGTTPGSSNGSNTGPPATGSFDKTVLVVASLAVLLGLLAGVVGVLLVIRNRKAASVLAAIPPVMSHNPWQASWSNPQGVFANEGAMPPVLYNNPAASATTAMFQPQVNNMPPITNMPAPMPVPVGAEVSAGNGNWHPPITVPADPALDAMQRRAQEGLFAAPRPFQDERSQ
ncbi:MAG TPA: hypothetical protein VJO32_00455 [Ktedonobacteraceae bacterium]|nr:hypothetical protein [Ktedonobacteraceae bacterium]